MHNSTRRAFLLRGGALLVGTAALYALPRPLLADLGAGPEPVPPLGDPRLKELVLRAIDAAHTAGAVYADARLTHSRFNLDNESMTAGVRALVDGYWGFAGGPVWSPDELARLGREAVHQAKVNAHIGGRREVELAPTPVVSDGHWETPIEQDPYELSPLEVSDIVRGIELQVPQELAGGSFGLIPIFQRQDKVFASSAGSVYTQRTSAIWGQGLLTFKWRGRQYQVPLDCLTPAALGFEYFFADRVPLVRDAPLVEMVRRKYEEVRQDLALPVKPIDVGRYVGVFDVMSMARLTARTLGVATQLDRAMGYEANAGGTSYITDPLDAVGRYDAGAHLLSVTGNRSEPGGCATVGWDDDGVAPNDFPIIKGGTLVDFQTTRESAGWLKAYYEKAGMPYRSHGCAASTSAVDPPLQRTPNLVLEAAHGTRDFDELVAGVEKGIAFRNVGLAMDFQGAGGLGLADGTGGGPAYEVRRGKRVAIIGGAGFLFRTPELWKGLIDVGGEASLRRFGRRSTKGQPAQVAMHSVTVPPAVFKEISLIDPKRKA